MYEAIESMIKNGYKLRVFRSGGGLRVIRIENKTEKLVAYAENVTLMPAFEDVEIDCLNGGEMAMDYVCKYLTGDPNPDSKLDAIILSGGKIIMRPAKRLHTIKPGKHVGNGMYEAIHVPAIELVVTDGLEEEYFKLVGNNVEELLKRAETEAEFVLKSEISSI